MFFRGRASFSLCVNVVPPSGFNTVVSFCLCINVVPCSGFNTVASFCLCINVVPCSGFNTVVSFCLCINVVPCSGFNTVASFCLCVNVVPPSGFNTVVCPVVLWTAGPLCSVNCQCVFLQNYGLTGCHEESPAIRSVPPEGTSIHRRTIASLPSYI